MVRKIVVDDKIPYLRGVLEPFAEIVYLPGKEIKTSDLINADALITRTRTKCNQELLHGTKVRFIATATIGFDHIDTEYCEKNGIFWINAPGCNSGSVQQYMASALLFMAKKHKFNLAGKTIGIIGVGHVGKKVEKIARLFGMKALLNDPPRAREEGHENFVELGYLLSNSDIITLHVPLNKEGRDKTYHLINTESIKKVRKNSIIINSSRGEVVNNDLLKAALKNNLIKGAVLDVWENEPDLDVELLKLVDIGTPHIAGYSKDGKANGTAMSVQALSKFFNLELHNWSPTNIEKPNNPVIEIDGNKKDFQEVLQQAIFSTYNIIDDDKKLREAPADFEKLRGNYPVRREFGSYSLKLNNIDKEKVNIFKELGFNIIND